jgi:hypothetical protein
MSQLTDYTVPSEHPLFARHSKWRHKDTGVRVSIMAVRKKAHDDDSDLMIVEFLSEYGDWCRLVMVEFVFKYRRAS